MQLFVKALLKYGRGRQATLTRLEALDNPKAAIATLFDDIVAGTVAGQDHEGCCVQHCAGDLLER